jgi:hypothetical protein
LIQHFRPFQVVLRDSAEKHRLLQCIMRNILKFSEGM